MIPLISDHRCFFCFMRAFEKLLQKVNISNEAESCSIQDMITIYQKNWDRFLAPEVARELHGIFRSFTHNPGPHGRISEGQKREFCCLQ
jgi:damage-control phosphatase, subfamily I